MQHKQKIGMMKNYWVYGFVIVGLLLSACDKDENNENNENEENSTTEVENYAVGSIVCTDGSVISASYWPATGKTAQGVVFYLDATGQHGWAVALKNLGDFVWGKESTNISALTDYNSDEDATTDYDGYENTRKIRAAGNATKYPAAYSVNFGGGWYLPACGQLYKLMNNIGTINATLSILASFGVSAQTLNETSACWWSSTEASASRAWFVKHNGLRYSGLKSVDLTVRAVCDF